MLLLIVCVTFATHAVVGATSAGCPGHFYHGYFILKTARIAARIMTSHYAFDVFTCHRPRSLGAVPIFTSSAILIRLDPR